MVGDDDPPRLTHHRGPGVRRTDGRVVLEVLPGRVRREQRRTKDLDIE